MKQSHSLTRLATRFVGVPLLIDERRYKALWSVLGPRMGIMPGMPLAWQDDEADDVFESNEPSGPAYELTPDGVAVISIVGPLVRSDSWINAMCGLTSYASIEQQYVSAMADDAVRGILLSVDSPGGEVSGCFDLCSTMAALRGIKPVFSVSDDSMYSAAMALGSNADQIWVSQTGGVGSIGVIATHVDQSAADKADGLKYTIIKAGARKADFNPHEPLSDAAESIEQAEINRLYGIFCQTVAANRGMSVDAVMATEAGLFFGANAVASGLADQVGNAQAALAALSAKVRPTSASSSVLISYSSLTAAGTSVAANSEGGAIMPDLNNAADPNAAVIPQIVPQVAATVQPVAAAPAPGLTQAECEEVLAACELADLTLADARGLIAKGIKPHAVNRTILEQRAARGEGQRIVSSVTLGASAQGKDPSAPAEEKPSLIEQAEARAKAEEARMSRQTGGRR